MNKAATSILVIAIIAWGVLTGGIVYSHLAFIPSYLSDLPDSSVLVNGTYRIQEEKFWLMIHPIVLATSLIALALNWKLPTRRKYIASSFIIYIIVLVVTSLYFVPELMAFAKSNIPGPVTASEWKARGARWEKLSWIRGIIMLGAYISMIISLMKTNRS